LHLKKHNVACEETYRNKMLVELLYDRNIAFIGGYKMVREMTREEARKFKEEEANDDVKYVIVVDIGFFDTIEDMVQWNL